MPDIGKRKIPGWYLQLAQCKLSMSGDSDHQSNRFEGPKFKTELWEMQYGSDVKWKSCCGVPANAT